jgi:hypothetical protein
VKEQGPLGHVLAEVTLHHAGVDDGRRGHNSHEETMRWGRIGNALLK